MHAGNQKASLAAIQNYDTIVLGGGVYASGLAGLSFLKKNISALQGKKILVFFVGASPYDESSFQAIVRQNMKGSLSTLPCFYCRGAWDLQKMTAIDRTLCKMLQKAVANQPKDALVPWEQALMEAGACRCDWTDKKYLAPILRAIG